VRTTGVARGWQGERVALTGVVLRQRRVKIPELAFRVPGAVLADPVRLVDGWAHDRGAGSDAAGAMGVRVVHRDHGHAGNRAEAAWGTGSRRRPGAAISPGCRRGPRRARPRRGHRE